MKTDNPKSAGRARSIKARLGQDAYEHYRKTGEFDDVALANGHAPEKTNGTVTAFAIFPDGIFGDKDSPVGYFEDKRTADKWARHLMSMDVRPVTLPNPVPAIVSYGFFVESVHSSEAQAKNAAKKLGDRSEVKMLSLQELSDLYESSFHEQAAEMAFEIAANGGRRRSVPQTNKQARERAARRKPVGEYGPKDKIRFKKGIRPSYLSGAEGVIEKVGRGRYHTKITKQNGGPAHEYRVGQIFTVPPEAIEPKI